MNQLFSVKKDSNNELWWKPMLSMQQELNRSFRDTLANFTHPTFVLPSLWDAEEDMFSAFQCNTHRLFSELFNNRQMLTPWCTGVGTEPYVDIVENGECFKVKADVPGLKAKDLEVSISDCAITIKGQKQEEKVDEGDNYIRKECHSGSFIRTIALPEEADMDKAKAIFEDNALKIEIPKKTEVRKETRKLRVENEDKNLPSTPLNLSLTKSEDKSASEQDKTPKDKKTKAA